MDDNNNTPLVVASLKPKSSILALECDPMLIPIVIVAFFNKKVLL